MRNALALMGVLAGCSAGPQTPAKRWTTRDFIENQGSLPEGGFGGWMPDELLTLEGAPLRFLPAEQKGGPGLTLFPGVSEGAVAPFVITEIWQDHPEPWVQPVWIPLDENGVKPVGGAPNIFPMNVDATFYSPFWRGESILTPGLTATTYTSGRDVLSSNRELRAGTVILCPFVPPGTGFADDGSGSRDPMARQPVSVPESGAGLINGASVTYLDFGPDRAPSSDLGQRLIVADAYFFVAEAGQRPLPLAAVLPAEPLRHSFVHRIDVVLPPGAAPFVPSNRPELRRLLEARGVKVPDTLPALDAFGTYALRVALDTACFSDLVNFPTACTWLDTQASIDALPLKLLIDQPVQLAIGVVRP